MAQKSWPFENADTTETQYSLLAREWLDTGVLGSFGDGSLLTTADSTGMTVKVAAGRACVRGHLYESTAVETLPIASAGAAARVDLVVLRLDPSANSIVLAVKTGTAGSPTPPYPTQTDAGVYEMPLARVAVAAGTVTIAAAAVTQARPWVGHRIGVWTSDTRPSSPRTTKIGWNVTLTAWEWWDGTTWSTPPVAAHNHNDLYYTKASIDGALANKAGVGHTHDERYHVRSEVVALVEARAPQVHTHDDRYFTEAEVNYLISLRDTAIASKANAPTFGVAYQAVADLGGGGGIGLRWNGFRPVIRVGDSEWELMRYGDTIPMPDLSGYATISYVNSAVGGRVLAYGGDGNVAQYAARNATPGATRTNRAVWQDSDGFFGQNTSSRRFKRDIVPAVVDVDAVLALEPVTFRYRPEHSSDEATHLGLIAEDVPESLIPWLQLVDAEGVPDGVSYEMGLPMVLLAAVQAQARQLAELVGKVDALADTVGSLHSAQATQIANLVSRVAALEERP